MALFGRTGLAQDCPEPVGRWPHGSAFSVAVSGDYAYLGNGTVLVIVDVSNPAVPQWHPVTDLIN
jgi:hypothetical protein